MQFSEAALNAQLDAIGELLVGGRLCVFDGPRKNSHGDPIVEFAVESVGDAKGGRLEVVTEDACIARREGTAQWYAWLGRDGVMIATGDVGKDLQVTPAYLVAGTRAMVDKIIWRLA